MKWFILLFFSYIYIVSEGVVLEGQFLMDPKFPRGFTGHIQFPAKRTYQYGWLINITFNIQVHNFKVPEGDIIGRHPSNQTFIITNLDYNRVMHKDTTGKRRIFCQGSLLVLDAPPLGTVWFIPFSSDYETMEQALSSAVSTGITGDIPPSSSTSSTTTTLSPASPSINTPIEPWWPLDFEDTTMATSITTTSKLPPTTTTRPNLGALNLRYNLRDVITKSLLFFEAQRSGLLPEDNRIKWRSHSALSDGSDRQLDLSGGYYIDGGFVKYGFPMAFSTTMLAWGVLEFRNAYLASHQIPHVMKALKWSTDYFIKCHVSPYEFYGQVSTSDRDNAYWGRPEEFKGYRPSFLINQAHPGSELAAETAAAMAATAMVFNGTNSTYSSVLIEHAKQLFRFADRYRGNYHESIPDAAKTYRSWNGYWDELSWAALWLYKATGEAKYLESAKESLLGNSDESPMHAFNWDDKRPGVILLLSQITQNTDYTYPLTDFCDFMLPGRGAPYTSKGFLYIDEWGPNRHAANIGVICTLAAKLGINTDIYRRFANGQLTYMLGDGGRSYVVGFGENPPTRPYHRASTCPDSPSLCTWANKGLDAPNPQQLTGALVGGPDSLGQRCFDVTVSSTRQLTRLDFRNGNKFCQWLLSCGAPTHKKPPSNQHQRKTVTKECYVLENHTGRWDFFQDDGNDFKYNSVGLDYNAGLQTLAAGILELQVTGKTFSEPNPEELIAAVSQSFAVKHDYREVIEKSLLFYEAQRAGQLSPDSRIPWRQTAFLNDRGNDGEDLSGGYFDAGDYVKFNFPMAYTTTVLAWGIIKYEEAYKSVGELRNARLAIKWATDYFIKCHVSKFELYGQVGNGVIDHSHWKSPNGMESIARPAYKLTKNSPGTELAAETAAALAATAIVFNKTDPAYSALLIEHAQDLYDFANLHRERYHRSIRDASDFYRSFSGYEDEMVWALAWLTLATKKEAYLIEAEEKYSDFNLAQRKPPSFSWDEKTAGVELLLIQITNKDIYRQSLRHFCSKFLPDNGHKYTPRGLVYIDEWGPLRHAAGVAFICMGAAEEGIRPHEYRRFAKRQIHYILGDSGVGSFVVGYGPNPPTRPHHRASSCPIPPASCGFSYLRTSRSNLHVLHGAVVGGPDESDQFIDIRNDVKTNEVALDYNACFQSAVAGLKYLELYPPATTTPVPTTGGAVEDKDNATLSIFDEFEWLYELEFNDTYELNNSVIFFQTTEASVTKDAKLLARETCQFFGVTGAFEECHDSVNNNLTSNTSCKFEVFVKCVNDSVGHCHGIWDTQTWNTLTSTDKGIYFTEEEMSCDTSLTTAASNPIATTATTWTKTLFPLNTTTLSKKNTTTSEQNSHDTTILNTQSSVTEMSFTVAMDFTEKTNMNKSNNLDTTAAAESLATTIATELSTNTTQLITNVSTATTTTTTTTGLIFLTNPTTLISFPEDKVFGLCDAVSIFNMCAIDKDDYHKHRASKTYHCRYTAFLECAKHREAKCDDVDHMWARWDYWNGEEASDQKYFSDEDLRCRTPDEVARENCKVSSFTTTFAECYYLPAAPNDQQISILNSKTCRWKFFQDCVNGLLKHCLSESVWKVWKVWNQKPAKPYFTDAEVACGGSNSLCTSFWGAFALALFLSLIYV